MFKRKISYHLMLTFSLSYLSNVMANEGLIKCSGVDLDPIGYIEAYPDLKAAGVDACTHFTHHGKGER